MILDLTPEQVSILHDLLQSEALSLVDSLPSNPYSTEILTLGKHLTEYGQIMKKVTDAREAERTKGYNRGRKAK